MAMLSIADGGLCEEVEERAKPVDVAEWVRVQELLRYFQPSVATAQPEKARVAKDSTLTAYAQLCTWKLDCQRSFISLMDHETQYIIAEATRTVSLQSEDIYDGADDAIYLGARSLDLHWGVCPSTIKLFTSTDGSMNVHSVYVKATESYYVMNDLSKIPEFESRPYVAGWPFMKYYAEVPIHSPSGFTIGTLCVVDDKPREGLDMKGLAILREIAAAVMDHLDLVVSRVQRKRAERMINGLGHFVESTSVQQWWTASGQSPLSMERGAGDTGHIAIQDGPGSQNTAQMSPELSSNGVTDAGDGPGTASSSSIGQADAESSKETLSEAKSIAGDIETDLSPKQGNDTTDEIVALSGSAAENQALSSDKSADNGPKKSTDKVQSVPFSDIEETLWRATSLIREAVDLDGVVFFDPSSCTPDHRISSSSGTTAAEATEGTLLQPAQSLNGLPGLDSIKNGGQNHVQHGSSADIQMSRVLASATRSNQGHVRPKHSPLSISQNILRRIVSKFNRGGVLKFDRDGLVTVNELELSWYNSSPKHQKSSVMNLAEKNWKDSPEVREIHRLLPGVSAVILFPIWNARFDKLVSFNIAWTSQATRVFQREDFAYLASFGNLIMAELSRLDTVAADRAKTDFIGSISHELRSPLHGILASAELLKDLVEDSISMDIINTIEACGSTLLDSLNDLLTFAKINNLSVKERQGRSVVESGREESQPDGMTSLNLDELVEDVVNASISGHQFRKALEGQSTDPEPSHGSNELFVICDIEFHNNWTFDTEAGAWTRIVLNLLGNALKYTTKGTIKVQLEQVSSASGATTVVLSVEDTGQGISEEYLTRDLFKPFRQENSQSQGTGLGLSIVHQLVLSMHGKINVSSDVGSGSKFVVRVPLQFSTVNRINPPKFPVPVQTLSQLNGLRIGFLDEQPDGTLSHSQNQTIKSSLLRAAGSCFGLTTSTVSSLTSDSVDILMTTESRFKTESLSASGRREVPVIVLSADLTLDYRPPSDEDGRVVYLSQPFGPRRFARALECCITETRGPLVSNGIAVADATISKETAVNGMRPVLRTVITATPRFESSRIEKNRPRVMLVEDNPINLKLLVAYMKKVDYPYATATNGLEAVHAYKEANGDFGMIFMDIQMPLMNGMKATYEIREFERLNSLRRTVIIALTGLGYTDAREEAERSGVDKFLTKPVPLKTLKGLIEEHVPLLGGAGV